MHAVCAMWSPGPGEIILIAALMLLLFGRRLPEVGRSLGRGIVEFKKGVRGVTDEVKDADTAVREQDRRLDQQARPADDRPTPTP